MSEYSVKTNVCKVGEIKNRYDKDYAASPARGSKFSYKTQKL